MTQINPLVSQVEEAADFIQNALGDIPIPETMVILGSGFKSFADKVDVVMEMSYSEIPHFHTPKVSGHGTSIIFGTVGDKNIALFSGRIHLYEGFSANDVCFPVRVLAKVGAKNLVVTNAAGGLNPNLNPGDVLALEDQINFTGQNCLTGDAKDFGAQFVDMCNCYDQEWRERIISDNSLQTGVYLGLLGPTYETPAETRFFGTTGANAVGMSTVQEVIAARQMGMTVAGLSFVTNLAGGLSSEVSHTDVLEIGRSKAGYLAKILESVILTAPEC